MFNIIPPLSLFDTEDPAPSTIIVTVSNVITLSGLTPEQLIHLQTLLNFKYEVKEMRQRELVRETYIYPVVTHNDHNGLTHVPYGALHVVKQLFPDALYQSRVTQNRAEGLPPLVIDREDREGQKEALQAVYQYWKTKQLYSCCLIAPCGAGKSWLGVRLIDMAKQQTLIVCHTKDLLDQWVQNLERAFPGVEIGIIAAGKCKPGLLTVALIQTLVKFLPEVKNMFGMMILDEMHHLPASTFCTAANTINARFKIGLTASEKRPDGLHPLIYATMGPIVHRMTQERMTADNVILAPYVWTIRSGWQWHGEAFDQYARMITAMSDDRDRNELIVDTVLQLAEQGRNILCISGRVEHCKELQRMVERLKPGLSQVVVGTTNKTKRKEVITQLRAGFPITFASTNIAKEGLDAPLLDTLVWGTPACNPNITQQAVGRIQRAGKSNTPLVVDFRDDECYRYSDAKDENSTSRLLFYHWRKRQRVYKMLGATIEEK